MEFKHSYGRLRTAALDMIDRPAAMTAVVSDRTRCTMAINRCATDDPALRKLADGNAVAYHLA